MFINSATLIVIYKYKIGAAVTRLLFFHFLIEDVGEKSKQTAQIIGAGS